jgi:leukotriene-A4 hydrolase
LLLTFDIISFISHANPSHFWLNEGWTTYIERVLQEFLHSPAERGFAFVIGSKALYDSLRTYNDRPKYQRLIIEFEAGEDPDEAYSSIPYEKGANFILHLGMPLQSNFDLRLILELIALVERTLGGLDVFLPYVKDYVETFIGQSITTAQWKEHLFSYWEKHGGPEKIKALNTVDFDAWFYGEGVELPVKMEYDLTLAETAYKLAERWDAARNATDIPKLDFKKSDLEGFNSNQIGVYFHPSVWGRHVKRG